LETVFSNYESPLFFLTFNAADRRPILATETVHRKFREYAERGLEMKAATVGRYVIMPDHVHLFVSVFERKLSTWEKGLKRAMSAGVDPRPDGESAWQAGFFDHLIRNQESYEQKWNYVRMNPVRAGLVGRPEDWPYQGEIALIDRL
jgi:REP element-mobilizing transposase RayT